MTAPERPNDHGRAVCPRYCRRVDVPEHTPQDASGWDRRRTTGAIVGGALVLGVIALLVVGLLNKGIGTSIQDAIDEGRRPEAPRLELSVLAAGDGIGPVGGTVSTDDLRGTIVVLNFWASWCLPCEEEAPVLEAVAARYRDSKDVLVLGVDVQNTRESALEFIRDNGLTYPSLRDGGDAAQRAYEVPRLPETFIIDRQGRIALKIAGQLTDTAQLTTAIEQLRTQGS